MIPGLRDMLWLQMGVPVKTKQPAQRPGRPRAKQTATLFTVGYEGRDIASYIELLLGENVRVLCDVRKNPISRKYGFSKKRLRAICEEAGIEYIHMPSLGIDSRHRQNLNSDDDYQKLFRFYRSKILKHETESLEMINELLSSKKKVAITCFEKEPAMCHRGCIADSLRRQPAFAEVRNL